MAEENKLGSDAPNNQTEFIFGKVLNSNQETVALINRLHQVAEPGVVFSAPIQVGDYTVITASELSIGLGAGFGSGGGGLAAGDSGSGGGGGGGGTALGRPVAVISIGPDGVQVKEVVDPTKIAIALFTTLGAIFMAWRAMRRASN